MPPRKRAETKPEPPTREPQETVAPPAEDSADSNPPESPDGDPTTAGSNDTPGDDQAAAADGEQPCTECFPNGWPAEGTNIGCVHGNWARD